MNREPVKSTPVTRELDSKGIPYRLYTHPGSLLSLEQAAKERGQCPEQVVRSIVFHLSEGDFLMVLVGGPSQISWSALRRYLGVSRIRMANSEEVLARTGYETGAVSPFALSQPMPILVDEHVFREEELSIGSGIRYTTVILRSDDLRRALGEYQLGCFVKC